MTPEKQVTAAFGDTNPKPEGRVIPPLRKGGQGVGDAVLSLATHDERTQWTSVLAGVQYDTPKHRERRIPDLPGKSNHYSTLAGALRFLSMDTTWRLVD